MKFEYLHEFNYHSRGHMKSNQSHPNIIAWKQRHNRIFPQKRKLLSNKILESEAAKLVDELFLLEDEAPPSHAILSSVYYSEYSFYCRENEVTPLSRRAFSILAQKYVISEKGKQGKMWYTLKPHILNLLKSKLNIKIPA